jgi:Tfp pilus assembly protein PilX
MHFLMLKNKKWVALKPLKNESGFAFVAAILLLTVLSLLVAVGTKWASQDIKRASNYKKNQRDFLYC